MESSDSSVVSVDNNGNLTAVKKGMAVITVSNAASGLSAECSVTVKTIATVSSQSELEEILAEGADKIEINVTSGAEIIIPKGNYENTSLTIKGGKGTIINNGAFDSVTIVDSQNYTEAGNNKLTVNAASDISIKSGAIAAITVNVPSGASDKKVNIDNNGTVSELDVSSEADVRLEGKSNSTTPVDINISSEGVKLVTNHEANVNATAKAELVFTGETENTTVTIDKADNMPDISGSGYIEVTDSSTGDKTVVIASPSEEMGVLDISGNVLAASDQSALFGVEVQLVAATKYKGTDTEASDIVTATTDEEGNYKFEQIPGGNYYMTMKKDGYKDAIQLLAAASKFNSEYVNERMYMLPSGVTDNNDASVYGTVLDATNKNPVEGITVELRINKGNIIGEPYKTVKTDSSGSYEFAGLEAEQYTVRVLDQRTVDEDKYISKYVNVCVKAGSANKQNINISKPIKGTGIRFVLSWGDSESGAPKDLDSHLFGPTAANSEYNIHELYYSDKVYGMGDNVYSSLDTDETNYNGPETTTIVKPINGIYYYYVYKYSDLSTLQESLAQVDIYSGSELLTTFNVPTGSDNTGRWWKVCSYNSVTQQIISYNSIEESVYFDEHDYGSYGDGISNVEHGYFSGFNGITFENEEYEMQYTITNPNYDVSNGTVTQGRINIKSNEPWEVISQYIEYEAIEGYTAEFNKDAGKEGSVGYLTIKNISTQEKLTGYDVYYSPFITIFAPDDKCISQNYSGKYNELYISVIKLPTSEEVSAWNFTCSDDTVDVEFVSYDVDDCEGRLKITEANDSYDVWFYISQTLITSMKYNGNEIDFDEYNSVVYLYMEQDDFDNSLLTVNTVEGYTAECKDVDVYDEDEDETYTYKYIIFKDSDNNEVTRKKVYFE